MGSPVAPLITPWNGEVGHAAAARRAPAARRLDAANGVRRRKQHRGRGR
jgi:hypothetical protein